MWRSVDQSRNRRDPELGDRDRIPPLPPFNSQARTNQNPPYDRYGTQGGRTPTQASEVILPNTHLYNRYLIFSTFQKSICAY